MKGFKKGLALWHIPPGAEDVQMEQIKATDVPKLII